MYKAELTENRNHKIEDHIDLTPSFSGVLYDVDGTPYAQVGLFFRYSDNNCKRIAGTYLCIRPNSNPEFNMACKRVNSYHSHTPIHEAYYSNYDPDEKDAATVLRGISEKLNDGTVYEALITTRKSGNRSFSVIVELSLLIGWMVPKFTQFEGVGAEERCWNENHIEFFGP